MKTWFKSYFQDNIHNKKFLILIVYKEIILFISLGIAYKFIIKQLIL